MLHAAGAKFMACPKTDLSGIILSSRSPYSYPGINYNRRLISAPYDYIIKRIPTGYRNE